MREIKWPRKGKDKREQNAWLISKILKKKICIYFIDFLEDFVIG